MRSAAVLERPASVPTLDLAAASQSIRISQLESVYGRPPTPYAG
jgi:hypothetical protein